MKTINNKTTAVVTLIAGLFSASANAALISVSGAASSLGGNAEIISAPLNMGDDNATNQAQQGFNEIQNYLLTSDLQVDDGVISAGTTIDSHMIFLNTSVNTAASHIGVDWTFSGTILGVMSDYNGLLEAGSSSFLGASGTTYPGGFSMRGLEGNLSNCNTQDCYSFFGDTLSLTMRVSEPGDWIRVITVSDNVSINTAQVPEPSTLLIFSLGLVGLGFLVSKTENRVIPKFLKN